jgi:serine/threonine-protein kinase RsbW
VEARFWDDGQPLARRIVASGLGAHDLPERGRGIEIALVALDELGYEIVDGCNQWRLVRRQHPVSTT